MQTSKAYVTIIKMKQQCIATCLLVSIIGLGCCVGAPTTRPLEHSPSELAWDAWLKQGHPPDVIPARRITTKSLFIFPNLGADFLPACAEGYRPDAMGRCVKVVKVNESAHLEFLLQKLNSQFATDSGSGSDEVYDYDIDTEPSDGSGPFQINIPLALHHSGHKSNENQQGEYVYVSKKDPPLYSSEHNKPSTSSPEIVPDSFNSNPSFFLNKLPSEPQNPLSKDNSSSPEGLSLLQNSTGVGITLLTPADEEIKSGSERNSEDPHNNMKKTEQLNIFPDDENEKKILTTTPKEIQEEKEKNRNEETNHRKDPSLYNKNIESSNHGTESENNIKKDEFVQQIEALKKKAEEIEESLRQNYKDSTSTNHHEQIADNQNGNDKTRPENIDIEEKIKIISQFADVSRNTQDFKEVERPYKNENSFVRFPEGHIVDYSYDKTVDLLPIPNTPVQLPINSNGMPIPHNSVYNVNPASSYEKLQPLHFDKNINEGNYKPQWLPYGWNVHGNSNGEQNLIDFWSRLSMAQRYPYNYNVRTHQEHRPTYYPSLYPSSRELSSKLINTRHTAVNHRQGRDQVLRRRELYDDDPTNHKRSLHPHFRNPNGYSSTLQAYNGR